MISYVKMAPLYVYWSYPRVVNVKKGKFTRGLLQRSDRQFTTEGVCGTVYKFCLTCKFLSASLDKIYDFVFKVMTCNVYKLCIQTSRNFLKIYPKQNGVLFWTLLWGHAVCMSTFERKIPIFSLFRIISNFRYPLHWISVFHQI